MIEIKATIEVKITEKTPTIPVTEFQPNRFGDLAATQIRQWFEENFIPLWREAQRRE